MLTGLAFVFIPLLLYVFLYFGAMVYAAYISLWRWGLRGPRAFLGVHNYEQVFGDPIFWKAVTNTLYYVAVWVPLTMALGPLPRGHRQPGPPRPDVLPGGASTSRRSPAPAAITVVWIFLLQPDGLFNSARAVVGLNPIFQALGYADNFNWLGSSRTAMNAIILLNAWTTSGTVMLFYLTFLQQISREIYEAAAIDGAGAWQTFRRITFPLLRPAHFFVATLLVIGGFKLFDQAIIAGGRGGEPSNALTTIVLFIYRSAITDSEFGYAAAVGVVLFAIIFTLTLAQRRIFGESALMVTADARRPGSRAMTGPAEPTVAAAEAIVAPSPPAAVRAAGDSGRKIRRTVAYALLIGYAFLMLIPFLWQLITSFKTNPDALRLTVIPNPFTLQGWQTGFLNARPEHPQLFLNSVIIAGAVTLTNLVLASTAGYAFARLRFPLREFLFIAVLGTLMIPDQLRFVPVYLIRTAARA